VRYATLRAPSPTPGDVWPVAANPPEGASLTPVATVSTADGTLPASVTPSIAATPPPEGESASITPAPTAEATETIASAQPTIPPTATPIPLPVTVHWAETTIDTYAYEDARYTDPQGAGHPYALLDWDLVGPPRPKAYRTLVMRNEYLELTFLPDLGGRLYQCRYLPTGQTLFYNNRVVKPTHWGPLDQGWWLAVGGIEFALPVEEHGYLTAEPWIPDVVRRDDGSASVVMRVQEQSRQIDAEIEIDLRPGEAGFGIRSTLRNRSNAPRPVQYWINAMLSPGGHGAGSTLRFYYPTSEVIVHSRGDVALPDIHERLPWPLYAGRDLSRYVNWRNWLGFFAPDLDAPYTAVYDEATRIGLVRTFPPDIARGAKLFAFGRDFDTSAYTDDGSQYVEMWGGLSASFWDDVTLSPQAAVGWQEKWYVLADCAGVSHANAHAAAHAVRDGDAIALTVCSPGAHQWELELTREGTEIARQPLAVRPDAPFRERINLASGNVTGAITVRIIDGADHDIITFIVQ
jgi:hypothetical protein